MAKVSTNNVSLRYGIQSALNVAPTTWKTLEPDTIATFGDEITKVVRRPLSPRRGRRKGTVVDRDATPEIQGDLTMESLGDFIEGFMFSEWANVEFDLRASSGAVPPPATGTGYTIDAASALLAGKIVFAAGGATTLVYARGYTTAANNGLKVLTADVAAAGTLVTVSGLVAETPPTNASLRVAGLRTDDLTLVVSGSTATLTSAADITNWATYGLRAGQWIHIGSATPAGAVQNAYDGVGTDDVYGYARITSIAAGVLNLDKVDVKMPAGTYTPETIDVMFGRFVRNVPTAAAAADNRYVERIYQIEATYPDLGAVGTPEYEYAINNYANELAIELAVADKATATWGFVGTGTDDITPTRKAGASTAADPLRTTALNNAVDLASITTDLISTASEVCFKSLTLKIGNGVSPEKCLGTLGAAFLNVGQFTVDLEGQMLFTNKSITNAIKNNTTATWNMIFKNEDGAAVFDIPSGTFGDGSKEYPVDASVLVNVTFESFTDPIYGFDLGVSDFATVPTVRS